MEFHRLDLADQGVESFQGLAERDENFLVVNLQRNRIDSFDFFGTHPYLTELHLQHNRIRSFRGLTKQASLRSLNLQGCPVACHPYYRIMALLTIGFGLEEVDGLPIVSHERHVANALGKKAALAVSYGWLLDLRSHTLAEYDAIIDELRRRRRDEFKRTQNHLVVTVQTVLANVDRMQRHRGYDATAKFQLADRQQTITRLARRVEQLERLLAASPPAHVVPQLPPCEGADKVPADQGVSSSTGFISTSELALTDGIRFSQGIKLRHNIEAEQGDFQLACLEIDHCALTAVSFFSREPLVQFSLRSLRVRHAHPLTLVAEDEVGGAMEVHFDSLLLLQTVCKALCSFSAGAVPPIAVIAPKELREHHCFPKMLTPAAASASSCAALEVEPSDPSNATIGRTVGTVKAALPTQRGSNGGLVGAPSVMRSSAAVESVADVVPLLQTSFSRPSTAARSKSIGFLPESTQKSRITHSGSTDTCAQQTADVIGNGAVSTRAADDDSTASGSPRVGMPGALPVLQELHGFAGLSVDCAGTDSAAFHTKTEGRPDTAGNKVTVTGKKGNTIPQAGASPLARSAAAPSFESSKAYVPLQISPGSIQAESTSAATPMSGAHEGDGLTETLPPRSPASHNLGSRNAQKCLPPNSSVVGHRKRRAQHDRSSLFQGATTDGGNVRESTVRLAAKDTARPAAYSRFAALLADSDSDSEG